MAEYCVGLDLGGTNIKTAIFTTNYDKIAESRIPTEAHLGSEEVLQRMLKSITDLLGKEHIENSHIRCVGIGVPGLLDLERGISKFSPNFPSWSDVPVVEWFQERLKISSFIDNDVRVNLYGEWYFGAGKGKKNVVLLTLGTGLGAGIVMDGYVLYGTTGSAGEIGHMNMYRTGRPCRCGSSGCLGRYVSALGMLRTLTDKLQAGSKSIITQWVHNDYNKITAKMISEAYDEGDSTAVSTMHETGEILGYGLVNIINLYNPETIIIGGGMSAAGERLLATARNIVSTHALKISQTACSIVTADLGDSAGMLGAAIYANEKIKSSHRLWA
ncbi:ROK family protein [Hydrogenoanaerobacterium sp.]|uniref:ROK family protein n=1 Tax=Hydrogenoanaerobacterium sp. TaxID=2953763 RepID=UPI0028A02E4F|nr:ROK family protein [Hydrogenoanaerobacterium sp.]